MSMELSGSISVADLMLNYGIEAGRAAYRVSVLMPDKQALISERIDVPANVMHAILALLIVGDEHPLAAACYAIIKDDHLPANGLLRPIP